MIRWNFVVGIFKRWHVGTTVRSNVADTFKQPHAIITCEIMLFESHDTKYIYIYIYAHQYDARKLHWCLFLHPHVACVSDIVMV